MSRKKDFPLYEQIEIQGVAADGKAVTRVNDLVVFVSGAVPGDVVDIRVFRKKRNYMEGKPVRFHKYSKKRAEPFCSHFGTCGGCKWQNLLYEEQLRYKQQQVADHLARIGRVEFPMISPILPSPETIYYRNKLEFTFSNRRWLNRDEIEIPDEEKNMDALGFHIPGRFDKVLDVGHCYLQKDPSNAIRLWLKDYALQNGLPFFDLKNRDGWLRNLVIRTSEAGEVMVILILFHEDKEKRVKLSDCLVRKFPEITSLYYVINPKANDSWADRETVHYSGKEYITEEMEGLRFRIGPKSFYQTNSGQAYRLYCKARDMANLSGREIVYDLYTGTGTIANFVAARAKKVIGIEYIPEAVSDAKANSVLNDIRNTEFFTGDIKDILNREFFNANGMPDVVILDPPRAGVHPDIVENLKAASPKRIIYISCNPATQARDTALLDRQYVITSVQPVDMFPHTHHVENIVLMECR